MNKQELIDKAVEELKGVLRNHKDYWFENGEMWLYFPEGSFDRLQLCTTDEFTTRARELGWINGYKWGVEYPTNGKKPDLSGDIVVEVYDSKTKDWWHKGFVASFHWDSHAAEKFRIVDDRYKPREPEQQTKPDNSWHERGELPPVGVECEYKVKTSGQVYIKCFFIGLNSKGNLVIEVFGKYSTYSPKQIEFRPIKTERDLFIEAAIAVETSCEFSRLLAGALYDAGFRAPD